MTPRATRPSGRGFFITGTDTGVGKTLACCALLHAFSALGKSAVGMKPVAAGASEGAAGLVNDDVVLLRSAGNIDAPSALVNPYCFKPPIAPHIAAELAGVTIDVAHIARAYAQLAAIADVVIVEGVGGFCVPLARNADAADLARHLGLPVILVVAVRLGCLNHALLTSQAIRARALRLCGWIANRTDSDMAVARENIAALSERLDAPLLVEIGYSPAPDARRIADQLDLSRLT